MNLFTRSALAAVAAISVSAPAFAATQIADGSAAFVNLTTPTVNYNVSPSTVSFNGGTIQISAIGGFAGASGKTGTMLGTLSFSTTVDATIDEALSDFFVFSDGSALGTFNFSVTSVRTDSYNIDNNGQSFALYLLGNTVDATAGLAATPTSLRLTFNQTGNSGFSASGTLTVPPVQNAVPEPASWAMMVGGFGLLGAALRRKRAATAISFS